MKAALVILAAGIGSRYGGGVKQLEPVGPSGEIIMDYSIHDAISAGFRKIVFIIRKDIEADFREVIGNRVEILCGRLGVEVAYAFQEKDDLPDGCVYDGERKKPWGTGHALWVCRNVLHEPFAVINADDYYGKNAFRQIYDFLQGYRPENPGEFCLAGFVLRNTLSTNGGVTRGICQVNDCSFLERVTETKNIVPSGTGAAVFKTDGSLEMLNADSYVSMNMWGLTPEFVHDLEHGLKDFFTGTKEELSTKEFLLPIFVDHQLQSGKASVLVLPTQDRWFGVTYKQDKPAVVEAFRELIAHGEYSENLFADLEESIVAV